MRCVMKKQEKTKTLPKIMIIPIIFLLLSLSINIFLLINRRENIVHITDENIVFFGDSITEQYNVEEFFPEHHVVNSGISGNKADDLLERIETDVYKYNPSKVFLLIGINDLNNNASEEEILQNIQKIVNQIKINRKNAKIYIESVYPINKDSMNESDYYFNSKITNDVIIEFNKKLENLCIDNDIMYIDIYHELLDKEDNLKDVYTLEGLHLTDLGYFKVTSKLQEYIEKSL